MVLTTWLSGVHGNLWENAQTEANGLSPVIDTGNLSSVTIMGMIHVDSALEVQVSQNGKDFYPNTIVNAAVADGLAKIPDGPTWSDDGVAYKVGDIVKHSTNMFWCIEDHVSNNSTRTTANADLWKDCNTTHPKAFHHTWQTGARYIRVKSPTDVLAHMTIALKP